MSIILPLVVVRLLDQRQFGLYKQVFLIVTTASNLLPLGFGMTAFYFLPRERKKAPEIVLNIVVFNVVVGMGGLFVLSRWPSLIARICGSPELASYSSLIGLTVLFWIVSSFLEIVAIASEDLKPAVAYIVIAQLSKTILLIAAVLWFGTVRALIYGALLQGMFQTLLLFWYLSSRFPHFWNKFDSDMMLRQLSYALPVGSAALLLAMQGDLPDYFVSHAFGPELFAIFAVGCFELPLIAILRDSVASVTLTLVTNLQQEGAYREIVVLTSRAFRKLALVYFPVYAFLLVAGKDLIAVVFTPRYLASWPIFVINLSLLPLNCLMIDPIFRAFAATRGFILFVRMMSIVVLASALKFWIQDFGMVGAIATVVAVSLLERVVTAVKLGSILNLTWADLALLKDPARIAVAAGCGAAATLALRAVIVQERSLLVLLISGAIFVVTYVTVLVGFRVVTPKEREDVMLMLGRLAQWRRTEAVPVS